MKIRWKVFLSALVGALLLNIALLIAAQQVLLPVMEHLEVERVQKDLRLGLADFYEFVDSLQRIAEDFGAWDDSYAFMATRSPAYVKSNLVPSTFTNYDLSFLVYLLPDGEPVYAGYYDYTTDHLGDLPAELSSALLGDERLRHFDEPPGGFLLVQGQVYALAVEPIVPSEDEKLPRGVLMVGRLLDQSVLNDFSSKMGRDFELELKHFDESRQGRGLFYVEEGEQDDLLGSIRLLDLFGVPIGEFVGSFPRDFSQHGSRIIETLLQWNLGICLVFALAMYLTIDKALRARELRYESEKKFRKLSAEFEMILDGIPDAIMLISPELQVMWANRAGAGLLADVAPAENGRYVALISYDSGFRDGDAVTKALISHQDETHIGELEDGRIFKEYAYPLLDDKGEVLSIIRLVTDITEATYLKREADQNSRLASIGELAAGVAHEINNPTGMLLLNLSLLTDVFYDMEPLLDEVYDQNPDLELGRIPYSTLRKKMPYLLKEMTDGSQRIKRIVEDLKGFARRDDDHAPSEIDVNDVAEAAVRLVEYQLSKATAHFSVELAQGLPRVRAHFRRLEQILVNLLVNATQALTSREQIIHLATRISHDGKWVVIEVEDQGRGIAPEDIEKVTDPFFTTRRNDGGTGLGLSLSARLIKEHDGVLRITSKPGTGSLFSIRLPVRRSDETE